MKNIERQKIAKTKQTAEQEKRQFSPRSVLPSIVTAEHILYLQRTIGNQAVLRLIQTKLKSNQPSDQYEQEANRVAEQVAHSSEASGPRLSSTGLIIQRQSKESAVRTETPSPGLIVEDEAEDVRPGQMRKSEFLSELKTSVCSAAEEALSGTIWSAMGCPYIERWFEHYGNKDSQHVERALRKYAPETAGARTAREYIPIVTQRVRRGIKQWTETGEVTGVPEEFAKGGMPGVTAGGLIGGLASGALSAAGSAVSGLVSGAGRAISGIGRALFKGREGGAREGEDPQAIQSQLGSGYMLDRGVKSRMGSAFGVDFSGVRIHTDSEASELSDRLNARAFTIGSDIAFGSGEYQPGTPIGDALIAHELAHVVQQAGGSSSTDPMQKGDTVYNSLEEDADASAVGAVVSVWGGVKGALTDIGKNAMPRLRSGLRLQRCPTSEREKERERLGGVQYSYLEEKRKKEEERQRKEAEEAAKKRGEVNPKIEVKVTLDDVLKKETQAGKLPPSPTAEWDNLSEADKKDWKDNRAPKAWDAVVASAKGTELEKVLKGKKGEFKPKEILQAGAYAYNPSGSNILVFGMSWVKNVEADPKNVWPNVAHELGGHFEYGTPYASEIMTAAIAMMPEAERKKWQTDPTLRQQFYETYEYPETEIFAALRERRYAEPVAGTKPVYGGMRPDQNIAWKLKVMHDNWAPEVAKAVLKVLRQKVDAHPEILDRDKKWFVEQVKKVFGYEP